MEISKNSKIRDDIVFKLDPKDHIVDLKERMPEFGGYVVNFPSFAGSFIFNNENDWGNEFFDTYAEAEKRFYFYVSDRLYTEEEIIYILKNEWAKIK